MDERAKLLNLLARKSVFRGEFTLTSGAKSDLYIDSKQTTLDPQGAVWIGRVGWKLLREAAQELGISVDAVGGLTMGADPIALTIGMAAVLESPEVGIQTIAVRKSPKAHGRNRLVEGDFSEGDQVVVIDDVITTGKSTLQAIEAIKSSGGHVAFVIVLVDREEGGRAAIEALGHKVFPIFTRKEIVAHKDAMTAAAS